MIAQTPPKLTIAVLAAGYSSRLGRPKALATVQGASLLGRTLAVLRPFAAASRILVIAPPRHGRYRRVAGAAAADFFANPQRAGGLSTSVRCAVSRARFSAAVLLLPVDLVRLESRDLQRLIACWRGRRRSVVARNVGNTAATPLILPHALFAGALRVGGDQGLREWLRSLPRSRISLLDLPSAEADVDTLTDLARARRRRGRTLPPPSSPSQEIRETPRAPFRSAHATRRDA